ncbi:MULTISPECIES: hypothetical protein [unclassified Nocardioides]|uniref:hypothetical protein n=1 Tax=unclassified Nocardioides TaxID=2615069 RepID=UPI0007030E49|nr:MULTISPECIES: hypothetical protein [unclassified Nocardioides]KRC54904.1 hypothetical protein ASE19_05465 [Nocardioides sp. Root79]KRC73752.1 hypothetical protein ASE20_03755 [Nocardioides sp. Root240]
MSQTASPQAAPPPPAAAPAPAAPATATRAGTGHVDTPGLLNRWQLIGMSVAIVFGLLSAFVQFLGWQSDGRAAEDTKQLQRVQEIQSSLLRADALATNAFLVGGLEKQRATYDEEINTVLREITNAADAQPADREVLGELNVAVGDYTRAVADARSNNRQGFPVGAEYLSGASTQLRADATPILSALVKANTERAEGSMDGQHPFWLLLIGLLALAGLLWLNQQLAQHFRRRLNKGIAVAAAIVLVVTVIGVVGAWIRDSSNDTLRDGDLALAISQAKARTAANDAKANESLALIKRGSGAVYLEEWEGSATNVERSLRRDTGESWNDYVAVYREIRKLDDGGNWEKARDLATTSAASGSSKPLDDFDKASDQIVKAASGHVGHDLRSGRDVALAISIFSLLLGIGAALFVSRGIGERRREFS